MTRKIRIKLDMPLSVDEKHVGKEHNQKFIAAQTKEQLVYETNSYDIQNGLLYPGVKIDQNKWIYHPLPHTHHLGSPQEVAFEIVNNLLTTVKSKGNFWLTKVIKRISVINDSINIETRSEIKFLDLILNDPALNIEKIRNTFLGDYVLKKEDGLFVFYRNKINIKHDFLVVSEAAKSRDIDIHWGIGTPTSYFKENDSLFSKEDFLPLFYFLKAGKYLGHEVWDNLTDILQAEKINNVSIIPTSSRIFDYLMVKKKNNKAAKNHSKYKKIKLYYSDYAPNDDIAKEISIISGGMLAPTIVDYFDIVMNSEKIQDGVVLNIKSPKHGGLAGNFPELYFLSSNKYEDSGKFQKMLHFCLNEDIKKLTKEYALYLESEIDMACRQFILGRLRPRFRTSMYIPITDTGLIKLSYIK